MHNKQNKSDKLNGKIRNVPLIAHNTTLFQLALNPKIITGLKFNQKDSSFPPLLPESVLPSWADPIEYIKYKYINVT